MILPESNDGTVSVDSPLKTEAQAAATWACGFNENHASVLRSEAAIRWVEAAPGAP